MAADTGETYDAALRSMRDLAGSQGAALAVIAMRREWGWSVVGALGAGGTLDMAGSIKQRRVW